MLTTMREWSGGVNLLHETTGFFPIQFLDSAPRWPLNYFPRFYGITFCSGYNSCNRPNRWPAESARQI